jgi:hypothetical protein
MNKEVVTEIEGLLAIGQYSKAGLKLGKHSHEISPEDFNRLNKRIKQLSKLKRPNKGTFAPVNSRTGKVFSHSAVRR